MQLHTILEEKRESLERLCSRYGVQKLEVFGSVTTDRFDPESSF